ncbi:hypothetical protein TSMEX_002325, partial [Taenia solium]
HCPTASSSLLQPDGMLGPPFFGVNLSNRPSFRFVDDLNIVCELEEELWYFMEGRLPRQCGPVCGECVSFYETLLTLASSMCDLLQSPSTPSSELDRSESDNVLRISTPLEHKSPLMIRRNSQQQALLSELIQRIGKSKSVSEDSTVPEARPLNEAAPNLLTKKLSLSKWLSATSISQKSIARNIEARSKAFRSDSTTSASQKFPNVLQWQYLNCPPKIHGRLSVSKLTPQPRLTPESEQLTGQFLWLMIENIPEAQETQSLAFKNNDIVRWLDFDSKYLEREPPPLPVGAFLDCETWLGKLVVVPSGYARLISSSFELAQVLQCKPRALVIEDFVGTSNDDLSVVTGEVIYLLYEYNNTHFMAMKKSITRGRVPKRMSGGPQKADDDV